MSPVITFLLWVGIIFLILCAIAVGLLLIGAGLNEGMDDETNDLPKK